MGGLVQGPQKIVFNGLPNLYNKFKDPAAYAERKAAEEEYIKEAVTVLNEMYADPEMYFNEDKIDAMLQKQASEDMFNSTYQGDVLGFYDQKHSATFKALYTAASLGKLDDFSNMWSDLSKLDDARLQEAMPEQSKEDIKSGKTRERLKEMVQRSEDMRKSYEALDEELVSPFDPDIFPKDSREYKEESIRAASYNHAKMLALFARKSFTNAVARRKSIYNDLSSDPIVGKMAANDIDLLVDMQSLISEINLLKIEIDIATRVEKITNDEGKEIEVKPELSTDEKVALELKQNKLILIQNIFNVLTNPTNVIDNGVFSDTELNKIENIEDREQQKNERDKKLLIIEKVRKDILSTSSERDLAAEWEATYSGQSNPFGEFDINKKEKFKDVVVPYLQFLAKENKDYLNTDRLDDAIDKILDYKSLGSRAEMLNKAVSTILSPSSLVDLAERIEPRFKKIYETNKSKVEERLKKYVDVTKKNAWLNELSAIGVWVDDLELEKYLNFNGPVPQTYYTDKGLLSENDNQFEKASSIISTQENISNQEEEKIITETPSTFDQEDIKYEENFLKEEEDDSDIIQERIFGDEHLKKQYLKYVKKEIQSNKKHLLFDDWVTNKISKKDRKNALVLDEIHLKVYTPLILSKEVTKPFYEWLVDQNSNEKVLDILNLYNVSIYDINDSTLPTSEFNESTIKPKTTVTKDSKSGINITERTVVNKDVNSITADNKTKKIYTLTDNNNNPVNNEIYYTKKDAALAKSKKTKSKSNKSVEITFGGNKFETGDILIKRKGKNIGKKYIIKATPKTVKENKNLFIKEESNKTGKTIGRNIYLTTNQVKEYDIVTAQDIKYSKNISKLKIREATNVNPTYDRSITNPEEQTALGVEAQQKLFRGATPANLKELSIRVAIGPYVKKPKTSLGDFYKQGKQQPNNKIIKNIQKFSVELFNEQGSFGYFNGPETVLLTDSSGESTSILSPYELTEADVESYFEIPKRYDGQKLDLSSALSIIKSNYAQSYFIYKLFEKGLEGNDIIEQPISDFPELLLKLSEGSPAWNKNNPLIHFDQLETMFVSEDKSITIDGEKPYYIIDYNRTYIRPDKKGESLKVKGAPITNINQSSEFFIELEDKVEMYESKFDAGSRLGKYVAFVTLPNGKSSFIPLTAPIITPEDFNILLEEMQTEAKRVFETNINEDGSLKDDKATREINEKINDTFFLAAEPGIYIELFVANDGQLGVKYSDMNKTKKDKKRSAKGWISHTELIEFKDVSELMKRINDFVKPIYKKGFILNDIKMSIKEGEKDIGILGTLQTKFLPEIKSNFNLQLLVDPSVVSIDQLERNAFNTEIPENIELIEDEPAIDITPDEKRNIINSDYQNIDPKYALEVVRRSTTDGAENMNDFEQLVLDNMPGPLFAALLMQVNSEMNSDISNTEALLDQNYQNVSFKASEDIKAFEDRYWDQRYEAIKTLYPNSNDAYITKKIVAELKDIQFNPENPLNAGYQTLKRIKDDAEGKAFKITDKFDGNDIEDINTYTNWYRDNLNTDLVNLKIDDLQNNMINNQMLVGQFEMHKQNLRSTGTISVGTNDPFKYHEAYHAVFRMFLTEAEIKRYLKIAKKEVLAKLRKEGKNLTDELSKMRKQHGLYAEMSRKELEERYYEEYMADEFEKFKMDPKSTRINVEIKNWFQRLLDILFAALGFPTYTLNSLFKNIDSGKYKNAGVQENRFTTADSKLSNVALKISLKLGDKNIKTIENGIEYTKTVNNTMPPDDQHIIISGMVNLFIRRKNNASGVIDLNILLDEVINDFVANYDPSRQFYMDKGIAWNRDNYRKIENYHNALLAQFGEIKELVNDRLNETDRRISIDNEDREEQEADLGDVTTEQWDKMSEQIGGFSSAPTLIRQLFSTVSVADQDMFGNKIIGENKEEPIMVGVNYTKIYDSILKAVSNESDPVKMLQKLWIWSQGSNVETKAVVDEVFRQTGLFEHAISGDLFDPMQPFPSIKSKKGTEESLFMMFINQFENYLVPYNQSIRDKKTKIVHTFDASAADDAHYTLTQWAENFNRKYDNTRILKSEENKEAIRALNRLSQFISYNSIPKNISLVDDSVNISAELFNATGMKFDSNYILFSLVNRLSDLGVELSPNQKLLFSFNEFAEPILEKDVSRIIQSFNAGENLFLDNQSIQEEVESEGDISELEDFYKGGVKGRLRKIALNNSYFDETVGASTFINEEGNKIYQNQRPTFHLKKISEMTGDKYIDEKINEDPFLEDNFLMTDPKFQAMVEMGLVKLTRISGIKEGVLNLTEDNILKENKGFNKANRKGTKFGSLTPQDFIVTLINHYLRNFNRVSPDNSKIGSYISETTGRKIDFAYSPTFIRVLETSNTGELVSLPVHKMIKSVEGPEGSINLTDEAYEAFEKILRRDAQLIQNELNAETITEDDVVGGNTNEFGVRTNTGRLYQLSHNGKKLLSKLKRRKRNISVFSDPELGADTKKAIRTKKQKSVLSTTAAVSKTNLTSQGEKGLVDFGITKNLYFTMTNRGRMNIEDMSFEQIESLIKDMGPYILKNKEAKGKMYQFNILDNKYYTYGFEVAEFFKGNTSLTKFDFVDSLEDAESEIIINEDSKTGQVTMDMNVLDTTPAETFEQLINDGESFANAWKAVDGRSILRQRVMDEANEFKQLITDFKGNDKISVEIREGLGTIYSNDNGTIINSIDPEETRSLMNLYNLKYNNPEYNLLQIFLNDYINTISFNDILLGDQRFSLKGAIDAIKRAKMQNAAGKSAESLITAPALGINHKTKNIDMLLHEDSMYKKEFEKIFARDKGLEIDPGERGDGQIFQTTHAARHFRFGFGELTPQIARIMNLIEAGDEVSLNKEFFGSLTNESYKQLNAILNSEKLVYADGKVYLKMSVFTLTPLLTSIQDINGNWSIPIDGRENLHNLRVKLEKWEQDHPGTVAIAAPKSASKMLKANMASHSSAFSEGLIPERNMTRLDAAYMRKQLVNPSNKIESIDPRQIKNIITSEQDLNTKIIFEGEQTTVGAIINLYQKAQSNKLAINWFAKRNLTFSFNNIYNEFLNPSTAKGMTINLSAFLKFAISGLESAKSKNDMLSYFKMNDDGTGSPEFNLNNQTTRKKFQTLFLSFLSKGVLSSRQAGISAALVTDDGFNVIKQVIDTDKNGTPTRWNVIREKDWRVIKSQGNIAKTYTNEVEQLHTGLNENDYYIDRLRSDVMEYDDNNEPTGVVYTEFVMAPHHKSVLDNIMKMNPKMSLPKAISKMFGIRIPSQDKHSAVNLMLVDFLPVYYGSSAIFARELVELSGADFDIDKLYMQIKDFFYDGKDFIEYGKGINQKQKYEHYINWASYQGTKKGTSINEAVEKFLESNKIDFPFNLAEKDIMNMEELDILHGSENILKDVMQNTLGLPVSEKEYIEYFEKYGHEPYSAAIDNKLLDYKYILQGNPGMINPRNGREKGIAHEPAVLKPLTDENAAKVFGPENAGVWEYIQEKLPALAEIVGEEDIDIDNLRGKLLSFKAMSEGKQSIGAVVSPNVAVNIAKEFNIEVRSLKFDGEEKIPRLTINGIEYTKFQDYTIDPETGKVDVLGYRTQFVISALITAMTDNGKVRLADKLGLNKQALAMVTTMTGMGVDINTSILLINQPVIKESFSRAIIKEEEFDPGIKRLLTNRKKQLTEFFEENNSKMSTYRPKITTNYLIEQGNQPYNYNIDLSYKEKDINEELLSDLAHEYELITQFITVYDQSESLRNVTTLLNLQKSFGEDLFAVENIEKAAKDLGFTLSDSQWEGSKKKPNLIPFDFRPVYMKKYEQKPSFHVTSYDIFRESYDYLFPKLFLEASVPFLNLKELMMDNMINLNNKKDQEVLVNNITTYLNTLSYMQSYVDISEGKINGTDRQTTSLSLNNNLIYDGNNFGKGLMSKTQLNIKDVYQRLINNKKKYNYFIDDFLALKTANSEDNWTGIDKLITNNFTQLNDYTITRVQNSFLELYADPNTHYDSIHLMHYLLVKDGFNVNNRGTFSALIPAELKKGILNSIDKVQTLFNEEKATDESYKRVFGMTFSELREDLVTNYLRSTSSQYHVPVFDSGKKKLTEIYKVDTEDVNITEGLKTIVAYPTKSTIIIEDESESSGLDIAALRKFNYRGKRFFSVRHAYEVYKTGTFNKGLDKQYRDKKDNAGGLDIKGKGKANLVLLTSLTKLSFLSNLNKFVGTGTYGDLITSATQFNSVHLPVDVEAAYIRGIKQAQNEVIWSKIMYGKDAGTFIYRSKSSVRNSINENKQSTIDKPATINVDEGFVELKLYAGLQTYYNKRIKTVKGTFNNTPKKENSKLLNRNKKDLRSMGVNVETKDIIHTKGIIKKDQMELPLVYRKTMKDGRIVTLQLVKYQKDGKYEKSAEMDNILTKGESKVWGNYAIYKILEGGPSGSKDQNPTGFLFGERPSKAELDMFEENKRNAFEDVTLEEEIDDSDIALEEVDEEDVVIDEEFGEADPGYSLTPEDFDEYTPGGAERIPTFKTESIEDQLEVTPEDVIRDFWNNLSDEEKLMLKDELDLPATSNALSVTKAEDLIYNIDTSEAIEALITTYNAYPMDVNEYIENIKKCHLK